MQDADSSRTDRTDAAEAERRFIRLWDRTMVGAATGATIYPRLAQWYGEPRRHYHSLDHHIRHCLWRFDQAAVAAEAPDSLEMALWFHDVVCVAGASDNEERSAKLFRQWSADCADGVFRQRVHDLILCTTHRQRPVQSDQKLIVDIDLSSFSLPWADCLRDEQLIRAEFPGMSDAQYYSNLLRFLCGLQRRPAFFYSDYFQKHHESAARANVRRLMARFYAHGHGGVWE